MGECAVKYAGDSFGLFLLSVFILAWQRCLLRNGFYFRNVLPCGLVSKGLGNGILYKWRDWDLGFVYAAVGDREIL
jgi:hypothetical protein